MPPSSTPAHPPYPVIYFDGVCNLCNGSVQFVIRRDKEKKFRFASLQSPAGEAIMDQFHLPKDKFNSFILYQDGKIYTRSTGALMMLSQLKGWKWTRALLAIPVFIRDGVYNLIARNRYRWFGRKDQCMVPTPGLKERFL